MRLMDSMSAWGFENLVEPHISGSESTAFITILTSGNRISDNGMRIWNYETSCCMCWLYMQLKGIWLQLPQQGICANAIRLQPNSTTVYKLPQHIDDTHDNIVRVFTTQTNWSMTRNYYIFLPFPIIYLSQNLKWSIHKTSTAFHDVEIVEDKLGQDWGHNETRKNPIDLRVSHLVRHHHKSINCGTLIDIIFALRYLSLNNTS